MISDWPQQGSTLLPSDTTAIAGFKSIQSLVRAIRNARAEYNVEAGKKIGALIRIGIIIIIIIIVIIVITIVIIIVNIVIIIITIR